MFKLQNTDIVESRKPEPFGDKVRKIISGI